MSEQEHLILDPSWFDMHFAVTLPNIHPQFAMLKSLLAFAAVGVASSPYLIV